MGLEELIATVDSIISSTVELDLAARALADDSAARPLKILFAETIQGDARRALDYCRNRDRSPASHYYTTWLLRTINEILSLLCSGRYRLGLTDQIAELRNCAGAIEGAVRFSQLVDQRTGVEERAEECVTTQ